MKICTRLLTVAAALLAVNVALAQAPAGATGQCKDGTYTTAASKKGACRGHKGVQTWLAAESAPAAAAKSTTASKSAPAPAASSAASGPAPAGATGQCKDGTYTTAATKMGACRGHKGVQTWLAAGGAPAAAPMAATKPAPAAAPAPMAPMNMPAKTSTRQSTSSMQQAAGGGPGMVWVNTSSKVYHCAGTKYYGKTKEGKYMSEADAKASGARPDHGNPCTK